MGAPAILSATRAQLGAANVPAAHAGAQTVDPREAPEQQPTYPAQPLAGRSWRTPTMVTGPAPGAPTMVDEAATLAEHEDAYQEPNPRQVWGGANPGPVATPPASPSATANIRTHDTVSREGAISDRPRAGLTSADGTRPASMPHWLFTRPFDKLMSSTMSASKVLIGDPHATAPYNTDKTVRGAVPSPMGGGPISRMRALGNFGQPNSARVLPDPWDADVLNLGSPASAQAADPAALAAGSARANGWRA